MGSFPCSGLLKSRGFVLICFSKMSGPMFPSLLPRLSDPLWFSVDKPCDDEDELSKLEEEQIEWVHFGW